MTRRHGPTAADRAKVAAARRAMIDSTPPTTRPGSETTTLNVGDLVLVRRERARSGSWGRYDGREGWVASINTQTFPSGATYVEIGVCWNHPADMTKASAEVWFRADDDELELA